jgi:equilibrative nucleoside transporter 1/2/3
MFLAAAPYFQSRFRTSPRLLSNFQPTELSISSAINLGTILILTNLQTNASYTRRIILSLGMNVAGFTLLAVSTKVFLDASAGVYFMFLMVVVGLASSAAGFMQNGAFAYAAGMGRPDYLQGIMAGQGVAGILPLLVQIGSVLSTGDAEHDTAGGSELSSSALGYFLTAAAFAAVSLVAFLYLMRRHRAPQTWQEEGASATMFSDDDGQLSSDERVNQHETQPERIKVPLLDLFRRLFYPSIAIFVTFAVTMLFPVFTAEILSTSPASSPSTPAILKPAAFIPLSFLVWNTGDLLGRLVPLISQISLAESPKILVALSCARVIFIPLYYLCNIQHAGSTSLLLRSISSTSVTTAQPYSDLFYLLAVQLPFGLSNGYIGSCCMMGSTSEKYIEEHQRESAGSFMGLALVCGLTAGSLVSFAVT